jgi:hypothetical protein
MAKKAIRPIRIEGNVAYVPLTQGYEAIIDAADVPLVEGYNWHAHVVGGTVYARRNISRHAKGRRCNVCMHREILQVADGLEVDHANLNGLDNRRANIRPATKAENGRNRPAKPNSVSGVKGVSWHNRDRVWRARIRHEGRCLTLGYFRTVEAAAEAYAKASAELHGDFGRVA